MDFQELIEYVEKRKPLPEDSGRSSSMTLSRGSPSNLAGKEIFSIPDNSTLHYVHFNLPIRSIVKKEIIFDIFLFKIADDVEKTSAEFRTCEKYIQNLDFNRFQIKALLQVFDKMATSKNNTEDEHI